MNYNNSPQLFAAAREHFKRQGIRLVIAEGHVVAGPEGVIARFTNDEEAVKCLTEAGYIREEGIQNLVFNP